MEQWLESKEFQTKVPRKKLNVASDCPGHRDELVAKLEEVDRIIRVEIRREVASVSRDTFASSRVACLMRARADVQSAITSLLGASH